MSQCTEAEQSMDFSEKLGTPKAVADQAAAALRYRTWAGRHPRLAFLAGAPVLFVLGVTVCTLLMVGLASFFEGQTVETMPALKSHCYWAGWAIAFVPPIAASLMLCRMVYVSGRQRAWALGACAMVALLAGCLMVACIPPQTIPGTGSLRIGFGLGSTWQFDQAIAPLLIHNADCQAWPRAKPARVNRLTSWSGRLPSEVGCGGSPRLGGSPQTNQGSLRPNYSRRLLLQSLRKRTCCHTSQGRDK